MGPPRGSTPSGSVAPSWLPCPPSSRCGSPSRSTTRQAPASSTGSASKSSLLHHVLHHLHHQLYGDRGNRRNNFCSQQHSAVNGLSVCAIDIHMHFLSF